MTALTLTLSQGERGQAVGGRWSGVTAYVRFRMPDYVSHNRQAEFSMSVQPYLVECY